ncbi:MAG: N-acetyltransferase [Clostridia bacterium]|nr:N-acetyltransferase [Clostridia bacterium]
MSAAINIIEVKTKKQQREFVKLPLRLYKDCPYYVPAFWGDEMKIFTNANAYRDTCKSVFYLAVRDGKTVGRIQGIIQRQSNELHGEKRVRFTRFDAENDSAISKALFDALEAWGKSQGMDTVCGPLGYSDLEREGLLVEGFDKLATFVEQYNYEYYAALIEGCGYEKEIDWLGFSLKSPKEKNEMLGRVAERALELSKLHVVDASTMSKKAYIEKYKDGFFECLDKCYSHLYGTVPFTESMKDQVVEEFMLILNKKYLIIICDENDKVVSFALCFPGFGEALQKSGGRMTPPALLRLLKAIKSPKVVDLGLVAVLPEYQSAGVNAVMLHKMTEYLESGEIDHFETNLNLETNTQVLAQWKYFDATQHKRHRSYIKKI